MGGWAKTCGCSGLVVDVVAGMTLLAGVAAAQTPSLTLIGVPPGRVSSELVGISADGTTAVGSALGNDSAYRGLSWTRLGGLNEWGGSPGVPTGTQGAAVSADGSVIAGTKVFGIRSEAFRYDAGGYQALGTLPAPFIDSGSTGISGNGAIIVGSMSGGGQGVATRWTAATGLQNVGRPAGTLGAGFTGISRDGSTAIGVALPDFNGDEAYSWTQAGGWRHLPAPAGVGQDYDAAARGVNFDGSLVVGSVDTLSLGSAVLWRNGVPTDLGRPASNWRMEAWGVSDDASVIVGYGRDVQIARYSAMIWANGGSPVLLDDYMASLGVAIPAGWRLELSTGVSSDGTTIVGIARNGGITQGFVATIPTPSGIAIGLIGFAFLNVPRRRR